MIERLMHEVREAQDRELADETRRADVGARLAETPLSAVGGLGVAPPRLPGVRPWVALVALGLGGGLFGLGVWVGRWSVTSEAPELRAATRQGSGRDPAEPPRARGGDDVPENLPPTSASTDARQELETEEMQSRDRSTDTETLTASRAPRGGSPRPGDAPRRARVARVASAPERSDTLGPVSPAALAPDDGVGANAIETELGPPSFRERVDAARRAVAAGELSHAAEELAAVRVEAPGTNESALAAFLLGRLAADDQGDPAAAVRWFRAYLREAPRGALAREARGRLLESLRASGASDEDVRGAARDYLEHHPEGPYAARARARLSD